MSKKEWPVDSDQFRDQFVTLWGAMQYAVRTNAEEKGFWDNPPSVERCLCLMHSEISEALEAVRRGMPTSDKIPPISNFYEELADLVIRIMDSCDHDGVNLAEVIIAKHMYNITRTYKHGKEF